MQKIADIGDIRPGDFKFEIIQKPKQTLIDALKELFLRTFKRKIRIRITDGSLEHTWWQNFVSTVSRKIDWSDMSNKNMMWVFDNMIASNLIDHNAKFHRASIFNPNPYIEFATEEDKTVFLLKWS